VAPVAVTGVEGSLLLTPSLLRLPFQKRSITSKEMDSLRNSDSCSNRRPAMWPLPLPVKAPPSRGRAPERALPMVRGDGFMRGAVVLLPLTLRAAPGPGVNPMQPERSALLIGHAVSSPAHPVGRVRD
jgi:hypothetical protein